GRDWLVGAYASQRWDSVLRRGNGRRRVLGVPLGAGTAHVVQLGPVGVEQGLEDACEVGEVAGEAFGPAAARYGFRLCLSEVCHLVPVGSSRCRPTRFALWSPKATPGFRRRMLIRILLKCGSNAR